MKVVESYTFTPGARGAGTIVIPEVIELKLIERIWDVTRGALIYEATNSQYGITSVAVANGATTLTIEGDTSDLSPGDELQILLFDGDGSGGGSSGGDGRIDAFGRQRVSEGFTLGDYKSVYGLDDEMLSATSGGGSSVSYISNIAAARLTAGTGATDYALRQSRMYHNYQPGKSQQVLVSFNLNGATNIANCNKRVGYFDDRNGIFLQLAGDGTLSFVRRTYVGGSASDATFANQTNWNVDPCDGTGPSGFDLDVTMTQLMFVDFQWLGVGRIRVGFVHDGEFVVAHEFFHSNALATVYWSQPSLPVRCEVRNTAGTASAATLDMICATVISEGGYAEVGNDYAAGSAVRTVGNANLTLPVMAIKLTDTLNGYPNRQYVRLAAVNVVAPAQIVRVDVIRVMSHTSITGGSWVAGGPNSGVEYNITATTYTPAAGDQIIDTFYLPSGGVGGGNNNAVPITLADPTKAKRGYIAQNVAANDSMAFMVLVTSLGNGATAATALQWREIG